jgi:aspartate aminotransferase
MKRHDQPPQTTIDALKRQRKLVIDALSAIPGLSCNVPGGAFYIFLDVRKLTDNTAAWCEQLLVEAGVALVPGEAFSAPGFARLTYTADEAILAKALTAIKQFVEKEKS